MSTRTPVIFAAALLATAATCGAAAAAADKASDALAYDIFKELIEINTTDTPAGNVTTAVEAMARRFRDAGFPSADVVVLGPENPRKKNVVVRLRGAGRHKPVLLIGHIDVVEAMAEYSLGRVKESQQALDEQIAKYAQGSAYQVGEIYAWRGEKDKAFEWLDRAYAQHDGGITFIKNDPLLAKLRDDPRYAAMLKKLGLPE